MRLRHQARSADACANWAARAGVAERPGHAKTVWGPRQGLYLLACSWPWLSLAACGYFSWSVMPAPPELTSRQASSKDRAGRGLAYWTTCGTGCPEPTTDATSCYLIERVALARRGFA